MSGFRIDVSEVNQVAVELIQAGVLAAGQASQVVRKTALDVEATAKQFAPVDTGNLRSSIGVDLIGIGQLVAEIGPTADYGAHVEFGTSRQAPAAYMGPALDRHTPAFVAALEQVGGSVLKP